MAHGIAGINHINVNDLIVNEYWNALENVLVKCIDCVAPIVVVNNTLKYKSSDLPNHIKGKITKRKRLLNFNKLNNCNLRIPEIKI